MSPSPAKTEERTIRVVVAENEMAEREKLKRLLAAGEDIQVIGEARDGKECLDLVMRQRPDIVLIKEDLPVIYGLDAAEQITSDLPDTGVIVILTGSQTEEVFRKMIHARISGYLTRPIAGDRLLEEVHKVAGQRPTKAGGPAGEGATERARNSIITVTGPRGGCGKTLIATNLAVAAAGVQEKVALIDLNLWGGDIAMLLDLNPQRTLGDLLPGFGGIDYDVVENVMVKHSSGLAVLAAPLTGTFDGSTLSKYMVQSILEALREHYETTVVDTGYTNLESTLAAMDYSDVILVVVGMDLPRLRDGKLYLKNLMAANYPKEKIRVVVNRANSSKEISPGEIESILEFPVTAQIPSDDALACSSVNLGRPFVLSSPGKSLSRSITALVDELLPTAGGKKRAGSRWFSFLH